MKIVSFNACLEPDPLRLFRCCARDITDEKFTDLCTAISARWSIEYDVVVLQGVHGTHRQGVIRTSRSCGLLCFDQQPINGFFDSGLLILTKCHKIDYGICTHFHNLGMFSKARGAVYLRAMAQRNCFLHIFNFDISSEDVPEVRVGNIRRTCNFIKSQILSRQAEVAAATDIVLMAGNMGFDSASNSESSTLISCINTAMSYGDTYPYVCQAEDICNMPQHGCDYIFRLVWTPKKSKPEDPDKKKWTVDVTENPPSSFMVDSSTKKDSYSYLSSHAALEVNIIFQ